MQACQRRFKFSEVLFVLFHHSSLYVILYVINFSAHLYLQYVDLLCGHTACPFKHIYLNMGDDNGKRPKFQMKLVSENEFHSLRTEKSINDERERNLQILLRLRP